MNKVKISLGILAIAAWFVIVGYWGFKLLGA